MIDALAGQGVIGTFASPRDPGTASIAWHHSSGRLTGYPGAWTYVRGGMGRVSFALADAAREAGAVIATGVPVGAIRPGEGVELEDGTRVEARAVVCNADPRRALALLDGAAPPGFRERVEAVPSESPVLKVNFALSDIPRFPQADHATRGTVNATGGADALDRACRTAQAGGVADELWCELYFQTVADPSVAPDGRHVMSAFCQYVPYRLAEGTWDERRDEIADRVETSIERFAPGFRDLVVEREALAPPDVETKLGLTGGHIFQGECLPEHMWDRRLRLPDRRRGRLPVRRGHLPGRQRDRRQRPQRRTGRGFRPRWSARVGCASRIPCNAQGSGGSTFHRGESRADARVARAARARQLTP